VAPFQVAASQAVPVTVLVRDSTGAQVRRWSAELVAGVNTLTWDLQVERGPARLADAAAGAYRIEVSASGAVVSEPIEVRRDPVLTPP
jgi:hypothetical protein